MEKEKPRISIVTIAYNQVELIERTILSVLEQGYENLEYIVIDGGSTDGTKDIIKKYADKLTSWISEHDFGRGDAMNKGFAMATGEIMGCINAGDLYYPWTFSIIKDIFSSLPKVDWLTSTNPTYIDSVDRVYSWGIGPGYSREAYLDGRYSTGRIVIQQESTFWRKSLWHLAGGYVNKDFHVLPDCELWSRFWRYSEPYSVSSLLGGFRVHESQIHENEMCPYLVIYRKMLLKSRTRLFEKCYRGFRETVKWIPILGCMLKYSCKFIEYNFYTGKWDVLTRRFY